MTATMPKEPKKPPAPEPAPESDKPKPRGPSVMIRPGPRIEAALRAFIADQRVKPDRASVGLLALEEFLEREGYLDRKPDAK